MKMFVSVSGPDGVGKTSTIAALHKASNYSYIIYDRDIPDQLCYAILAGRKVNSEWIKFMQSNHNQLYVVLNAKENIIKERMKSRNDSIVPENTTLEQAISYFTCFETCNLDNVLYIDNSEITLDEVVKLILNKLQFKAQ